MWWHKFARGQKDELVLLGHESGNDEGGRNHCYTVSSDHGRFDSIATAQSRVYQ
jgi:hypothetical protein